MLRSTIDRYRVLWLCHRRLTPKYRELVSGARQHKRVHHLRSAAEMDAFLNAVTTDKSHEMASAEGRGSGMLDEA